jgi:four helix bundle protein
MANQQNQGNQQARVSQSSSYNYRNLGVWQQAQALALEVIEVAGRLPKAGAGAVLARQVVASAASIGANIAEGHGRFSLAAYRNHLSIAKGSACETDSWLDLLRRAGYINDQSETRLHEKCLVLIGSLTLKIRDLERRERGQHEAKALREDEEVYS